MRGRDAGDRSGREEEVAGAIVVGAGLAGFATALALSGRGVAVTVLTPEDDPRAGATTSSALAQGGLAAAVGPGDSPALHAADTLAAGGGLCDPAVAGRITGAGPGVVDLLLGLGARFDRDASGALRLGLEGAHGRHRIVHADGDASGAEILRAVAAAALAHPLVTVRPGTRVRRLLTVDGGAAAADPALPASTVVGVAATDAAGPLTLRAPAVILATGGIGGLFAHTTNPVTSWGSGLALGLRAGASVRDLEMVQFHPTALAVGGDPMPLVSEAVRGEGVALVLGDGTPLADPLAGRDVVARAVWEARAAGHEVYLDVPGGPAELREEFATRFPTITASARRAGLDPARDRLPVRPAAHYHMGGLTVDARGRTDVPGLWAVGEVASTGLHGANRLASNSLLEAVACAQDVAADVAGRVAHDRVARPNERGVEAPRREAQGAAVGPEENDLRCRAGLLEGGASNMSVPVATAGLPSREDRLLLESAAGLFRDGESLRRAAATLRVGAEHDDARLVATLLVLAALERTESRGAHRRLDHPQTGRAHHTRLTLADLDRLADTALESAS